VTGSVSVIVPLADHHDRTSFSCGLEALDRYLREQAGQDLRRRLSAVFVFCKPGSDRILGYTTLSSCQVDVVSLPPSLAKRHPRRPVPATPIDRLAVDRTYHGQGAGEVLLVSALARAARQPRSRRLDGDC
jgi:ribosomal protein S18 acetylase RimI-like enzyme